MTTWNADIRTAARNAGRKAPCVPGTDYPAPSKMPTAYIQPVSRTPGRGGFARARNWVLTFEPWAASFIEPFMGWTGNRDPYGPIELRFPDRESAIEFVERQGWPYEVTDAPRRRIGRQNYAESLKRRLRSSVASAAVHRDAAGQTSRFSWSPPRWRRVQGGSRERSRRPGGFLD